MATLNDEIESDIYSDEIVADLFVDVTWRSAEVKAMVNLVAVEEQFQELGGSEVNNVLEFTFRRKELLAVQTDVSMLNTVITYNGRKYDINEVFERGDHPKITVLATLRDNS